MQDIMSTAEEAVLLIAVFGVLSFKLVQVLKVGIKRINNGVMPEGLAGVLAGLISCGLTFYVLSGEGVELQIAITATLIAFFAPQTLYDTSKAIRVLSQEDK